jgi:hypothetical protein
MEKFNELKAAVLGLEDDITKFYDKGNKAASVRVRKQLQLIKALAQEVRADISAKKKGE